MVTVPVKERSLGSMPSNWPWTAYTPATSGVKVVRVAAVVIAAGDDRNRSESSQPHSGHAVLLLDGQ
jgi:hypothetical protein